MEQNSNKKVFVDKCCQPALFNKTECDQEKNPLASRATKYADNVVPQSFPEERVGVAVDDEVSSQRGRHQEAGERIEDLQRHFNGQGAKSKHK